MKVNVSAAVKRKRRIRIRVLNWIVNVKYKGLKVKVMPKSNKGVWWIIGKVASNSHQRWEFESHLWYFIYLNNIYRCVESYQA